MASSAQEPVNYVFPFPPGQSLDDSEDIRAVAELAYVWGWALVNVANRAKRMRQFADGMSLLVNGWPIGFNAFTLQTQTTDPNERLMCCPNSGLLYGGGAFTLGQKGAIAQVPQDLAESDIFWLYSLYDARTDQFGACGTQLKSEPGFYLIVGPSWDGTNPDPAGIPKDHIICSTTDLVVLTARVFIKPPPIPGWLEFVNFYPTEKYTPGNYIPGNWECVKKVSCPRPIRKQEMRFVHPLTFFDQLPGILDSVKAQKDEEALYDSFRNLLKQAEQPRVMSICRSVAYETERTTIRSYMQWSMNGIEAGNGWYTSVDSGQWPLTEYAWRTATAKSNLFENRPVYTRYYYTDNESNAVPLDGSNTYAIAFEGGLPPAKGPWSVTVYNQFHFLFEQPYSISNSDLCPDSGGTLVIHAGPTRPFGDGYWIRTPPNEPFSLYLRAYWMDESKLPAPWKPPLVYRTR